MRSIICIQADKRQLWNTIHIITSIITTTPMRTI